MGETNQIKDVKVIYNSPPTQEFQALGYDREHIINKVARANFYNFDVTINPDTLPHKINTDTFVRSETYTYGINGNNFIWDSIPELENFPVSGRPEEVSQQYVLYNVNPNLRDRTLSKLNIHYQSVPTAYNTTINTSQQQQVVMQVPKSDVLNNFKKQSVFQSLKKLLIGG